LTNAIYFKGTWVKEFEKKDTHDAPFRVSPDKTVTVDMMVRKDREAKFNYYENEDLQVLEMLYKGEELSMLVLLPKDEDLAKLEESLTAEKLEEYRDGLYERKIDVYLPKFTFETKYFMAKDLSEMGMPLAFSPFEADFSGMTGSKDLFISSVIHQAFVEVNEEGTEAAAATVVIMAMSAAMPMNDFRADHPFIFLIQERETGNILFIGRVVDPTAK
jgi:serpin B